MGPYVPILGSLGPIGSLIHPTRTPIERFWAYGARRGPEMGEKRFLGLFGLVAPLQRTFLALIRAHKALRGP